MTTLSEILAAADTLSLDEMENLTEILRHRIAERNRARLLHEIQESRDEFASGRAQPASIEDIMNEIRGEA